MFNSNYKITKTLSFLYNNYQPYNYQPYSLLHYFDVIYEPINIPNNEDPE